MLENIRNRLGVIIVLFSITALVVLAVVAIVAAAWSGGQGGAKDTIQLLFSSLLPLFGTWVGTVLAYFFSKENYEAARQGTLEVVRSVSARLAGTLVADAMMKRANMIVLTLPAGGKLGDIVVGDVSDKFNQIGGNGQKISRLPILDANDCCVAFLHRSVWYEMIAEADPPLEKTSTLASRLAAPYPLAKDRSYEQVIATAFALVGSGATVADAKASMDAKPQCQDVIVTKTGQNNEPLLGWISNIDIGKLSTVN